MAQRSAIDQTCTFFAVVHDPRRQHPTTRHPLETILTSPILATIGGAQHGGEIAPWGQAKAAWRAEFLDLPQGIPSHETLGRVCAVLDPASLQQALVRWMNALADLSQAIVAREGNTMRRSLDRADGKGPMHVVKVWASTHELGLAPCNVDAKTNEITALPEWLRRLHLAGAVVTIDAMGCPVEIARQMQAQDVDDVLCFKEHQPGLYRDGDDLFRWLRGLTSSRSTRRVWRR